MTLKGPATFHFIKICGKGRPKGAEGKLLQIPIALYARWRVVPGAWPHAGTVRGPDHSLPEVHFVRRFYAANQLPLLQSKLISPRLEFRRPCISFKPLAVHQFSTLAGTSEFRVGIAHPAHARGCKGNHHFSGQVLLL